MRLIDVRIVPLRDGRWVARVEGRRVARSEADRPSTCLALLSRILDREARARPEAEEASDASSALFAPNEVSAAAATTLARLRSPRDVPAARPLRVSRPARPSAFAPRFRVRK